MGDASLPPFPAHTSSPEDQDPTYYPYSSTIREINILVTGFGQFKSFSVNPSYLIASNLSRQLDPECPSTTEALKYVRHLIPQFPTSDPDPTPYRINVHVYPDPIRVAYDVVRHLVPRLVADALEIQDLPGEGGFTKPPNGFDYILHIGMAAGRENYTFETVAHRDNYKLKDVDDKDGSHAEAVWKQIGLPEVINVGWNKEDVLARWEVLTSKREEEFEHNEMIQAGWKAGGAMTLVETARMRSQVFLGKGKRAMVKLSRDAGRYLCEFIFYTSLGTRWKEVRDAKLSSSVSEPLQQQQRPLPAEKLGKVGFLHVPGGTEPHDIARGVRVAESVILALVGSWEDGYRNPDVYGSGKRRERGESTPTVLYEVKGTGDR